MDPNYPTTKSLASVFLNRAKFRLEEELVFPTDATAVSIRRDYNDHKAAQLLDAMAELLFAEARIDGWRADLGTNGCCGAD